VPAVHLDPVTGSISFEDPVLTRVIPFVLVATLVCGAAACRKQPAASSTAAAPAGAPAGTPAPGTPAPGTPAAPAPVKPMPAQLPEVLARVNSEAVSKADLDRLVKNMEAQANQPIPAERRDEILRKALDQLVTYTVLKQETRARKVAVTDAEIEDSIKQMRAQFPSEAEFTKALAARGMTIDKLREDARVDMSINKMMDAELATLPGPSDAQAREFYDKNPDKFKQDAAVRASHILIAVDEKADAAAKKKALAEAQSVLKQAKGGADFAALAKKYSKDGSASEGGDLNFFPKGQMVPAFDEAAFKLKPGEISDIVTTQFGYHIIKVTDTRPPSVVPFEQVNAKIKEYLTQQNKQEKAQAVIEALKQKSKIEVLV
jgi:peptidyl-prolyl cis-trans isomerase C